MGYFAAPSLTGPGTVLASAKINGAAASVVRSFNNAGTGVSVTRFGAGSYEVNFGTDVSARNYAIPLSAADGASTPTGGCAVTTRSGNVNAVYAECFDVAGTNADRYFMVQV